MQHTLLTLWLLFVQCRKFEAFETFEGLAWQLIKLLPSGYKRVDKVADTYQENSIKPMKRRSRGYASKRLVKSTKSEISRDFASFLSNNDKKTKMIELIFETIIKEKLKFLNILQTTEVYPVTTNLSWSLCLQQQM